MHKHKHMLKKIVNAMLSRSGSTHMFKVRAHIGVAGNELADKAAKIAAQAQTTSIADIAPLLWDLQALLPDGKATTKCHGDAMAGQAGLASSWLSYPTSGPDEGDAPDVWAFDELNTRWLNTSPR